MNCSTSGQEGGFAPRRVQTMAAAAAAKSRAAVTCASLKPAMPSGVMTVSAQTHAVPVTGGLAGPQAAPSVSTVALAAPAATSPVPPATTAAAAVAAPVPANGIVVFRAKGPSWIEVTDAKGVVRLRKLLDGGESGTATGALPLQVTVGRVDVTEVEVRGKAFDLRPVSRDNVARFEVK